MWQILGRGTFLVHLIHEQPHKMPILIIVKTTTDLAIQYVLIKHYV